MPQQIHCYRLAEGRSSYVAQCFNRLKKLQSSRSFKVT